MYNYWNMEETVYVFLSKNISFCHTSSTRKQVSLVLGMIMYGYFVLLIMTIIEYVYICNKRKTKRTMR